MWGSTRSTFERAVAESAKDLLAPYGFTVRPTSEWRIFDLESELWVITVSYADTHIGVDMRTEAEARMPPLFRAFTGPLTEEIWMEHPPKSSGYVMLSFVLEVVAPDLGERSRYPRQLWAPWMVRGEVRRQLQLLAEHCRALLEGDLALWSEVRERERYGDGTRRQGNETRQQHAARLRQSALSALQRREYWKANRYYAILDLIRVPINLRDRARRWWINRHIFFMR